MEEARDRLVEKVQTLSDLELAALVCLVAEQHCIIQTERELLDNVELELELVSSRSHGIVSRLSRSGRDQCFWPHLGCP